MLETQARLHSNLTILREMTLEKQAWSPSRIRFGNVFSKNGKNEHSLDAMFCGIEASIRGKERCTTGCNAKEGCALRGQLPTKGLVTNE